MEGSVGLGRKKGRYYLARKILLNLNLRKNYPNPALADWAEVCTFECYCSYNACTQNTMVAGSYLRLSFV